MMQELPGGFCHRCDSAYEGMSAEHHATCMGDHTLNYLPSTSEAYKKWSIEHVSKDWSCKCTFPVPNGVVELDDVAIDTDDGVVEVDQVQYQRCKACDRRIYNIKEGS